VRKPETLERFEDRGPGSLRNYLGAILDSAVLDLVRRQGAVRRGGGERVGSMQSQGDRTSSLRVPDAAPTPTSEARAAEVAARIEALLPPREFVVWRLRHNAGLDFPEIGRRLDISADAARALHGRARARLARELGHDTQD